MNGQPEEPQRRRSRGARLALVAAALGLHAFYLVGDRTWWGEWVSIWPPVGWLVLGLPALVRNRSWLGLGLLVLLVVVYGELPRRGSGEAARVDAIRLVSWNVAGDPSAWDHLRGFEADVIAVQESPGPPADPWAGYEWHGTFDPAVLTRFPARSLPTRKVGPWVEPQLLLVTPPNRPSFILANVRLVLPSIVTWVAGGFEGSPADGYEQRVGQYRLLADLLQEAGDREGVATTVLVGDFNAPARMPSLEPISSFLDDCWIEAGSGWGATATRDLPLARIDHCWVSPRVRAVAAGTKAMPVSDHRMLVVNLAID